MIKFSFLKILIEKDIANEIASGSPSGIDTTRIVTAVMKICVYSMRLVELTI